MSCCARPDASRGRPRLLAVCLLFALALSASAPAADAAELAPAPAEIPATDDALGTPLAHSGSDEPQASGRKEEAASAGDSRGGRADDPGKSDSPEARPRSLADPPPPPPIELPPGPGAGAGSVDLPAGGGTGPKDKPKNQQRPKDEPGPKDEPKPEPARKPGSEDTEEREPRPRPKPPASKPAPREEPRQAQTDAAPAPPERPQRPPPQRYESPPPQPSSKPPQRSKDGKPKAPVAPAALGSAGPMQPAPPAGAAGAGADGAAVRVEGDRFVSAGPPKRRGAGRAQLAPQTTVRIAGRMTRRGAHIDVLSVEAPRDSRVTVRCRGRDCPSRSQSRTVSASRSRATTRVSFRTLERHLRGGTVLEISVTKDGAVGKFTRFVIRAGKPPLRTDLCLEPGSARPTRCG